MMMEMTEAGWDQSNANSSLSSHDSPTNLEEDMGDLRRGPWTVEEDFKLINCVASHGEGRWNSLARSAGLKRTGKSCRLRWLNYLRPDVRRGNITLEEQLTILELHSRWGNRWSKIAQHLPGRTDNEIKNYWRTRVQKHAKQLKCDVNSKQFKDAMKYQWMPRLMERIQAAAAASPTVASSSSNVAAATAPLDSTNYFGNNHLIDAKEVSTIENDGLSTGPTYTPGSSSNAVSSGSVGPQVSPVSDLTTEDYSALTNLYHFPFGEVGYPDCVSIPSCSASEFQSLGHCNELVDYSDYHWNSDNLWFLQQQFSNIL